jgi:hypothetical protein
MPDPPPTRPWYKRKRTGAALALWLLIAYPLSIGPLFYVAGRGWLPNQAAIVASGPAWTASHWMPEGKRWRLWAEKFYFLGRRHAASS